MPHGEIARDAGERSPITAGAAPTRSGERVRDPGPGGASEAWLALIQGRRTPSLLDTARAVPREAVDRALACALTAPNHHATHPWRFTVVEGEARRRLGEAYAREQVAAGAVPAARAPLEAAKMTRGPVVVVAHFTPPADEVLRLEDTLSMGAAVENFILALAAQGLGVLWRTGRMARSQAFHEALGLGPGEVIAGILHVGYPRTDVPLPPRKEVAAAEVIRRMEDASGATGTDERP